MEPFSYKHQPFLLDSIFIPNTTIDMSGSLEQQINHSTCFPFYPSESTPQAPIDLTTHETSCFDHNNKVVACDSSSMVVEVDEEEEEENMVLMMEKKRKKSKNGDGYSSNSTNSKDTKQSKIKKQKEKKKKVYEELPSGYIHVRAKRGQATDSHSLAERVRREKISERMKLLQDLVPGCEKVTGKALMLDEIINYVQSLQNQVEFLSMKLASANPFVYDFGVDLDNYMVRSEVNSNLAWDVYNQRQRFINQSGFNNNFSSFQ